VSVRIRLQRKGARHMAFYRIVAADQRSPRDGRFIEQLGYYDPLRDPPEIKVDTPKVIGWLSKGAQPSETVESLLRRVGIMQMWHEVKKGKAIESLVHIEEEARKRIDAKASMERRQEEETRGKKVEKKEAPASETPAKAPAADATASAPRAAEAPTAEGAPASTSTDTESEPQATAAEAPAREPEAEEVAVAETKDAATDSGGGASQDDNKE
jgi:small subunit ribosomal protein S16